MTDRPNLNDKDMATRYADSEGHDLAFTEEEVGVEYTAFGKEYVDSAKLRTFEDGAVYLESEADGPFKSRDEAIEYARQAARMSQETRLEYGL